MALIENSNFYSKIEEKNYQEYLKLVCEQQETQQSSKKLENKLNKADKTIEMMEFLLNKYSGVTPLVVNQYQKWFSVLAVAAYLHNIFYKKEEKFASLMYARQNTEDLAKQARIPNGEFEYILQAVESVLGINGPQKLKAPTDTPSEMLVLAIMLVENNKTVCSILK